MNYNAPGAPDPSETRVISPDEAQIFVDAIERFAEYLDPDDPVVEVDDDTEDTIDNLFSNSEEEMGIFYIEGGQVLVSVTDNERFDEGELVHKGKTFRVIYDDFLDGDEDEPLLKKVQTYEVTQNEVDGSTDTDYTTKMLRYNEEKDAWEEVPSELDLARRAFLIAIGEKLSRGSADAELQARITALNAKIEEEMRKTANLPNTTPVFTTKELLEITKILNEIDPESDKAPK